MILDIKKLFPDNCLIWIMTDHPEDFKDKDKKNIKFTPI